MSNKIVATRYAKALLNQSKSDFNQAKRFIEELAGVEELFTLKQSTDVLVSPVIPSDLKLSLLNYGLEKCSASKDLKGFVNSVVEANRVDLIPEIIETYKLLVNDGLGVLDVSITAAIELPKHETDKIVSELENITKKKINVSLAVDHTILGGFIIKMGNKLLDLSLKTKLDAIAKSVTL